VERRASSPVHTQLVFKPTASASFAELMVKGQSIVAALFNHYVRSRQNAVAENFLTQSREIVPIAGRRRRSFRNDAGNHFATLSEFDSLTGT